MVRDSLLVLPLPAPPEVLKEAPKRQRQVYGNGVQRANCHIGLMDVHKEMWKLDGRTDKDIFKGRRFSPKRQTRLDTKYD